MGYGAKNRKAIEMALRSIDRNGVHWLDQAIRQSPDLVLDRVATKSAPVAARTLTEVEEDVRRGFFSLAILPGEEVVRYFGKRGAAVLAGLRAEHREQLGIVAAVMARSAAKKLLARGHHQADAFQMAEIRARGAIEMFAEPSPSLNEENAQRFHEDLLRLSRQHNDTADLLLGHFNSGRSLMHAGRLALSRSHLEKVLALYDPIPHQSFVHRAGFYPHVVSQALLGIVLFCLGFPDQALARSNTAVAEAQSLGHPTSLDETLSLNAMLLSLDGDNAALDRRAEQLMAVAAEQRFPHRRAHGTIYRGWALVKNGDVKAGMSLLRDGLTAYRATGAKTRMLYFVTLLASAFEIGQIDEASSLLSDTLQTVEKTGDRWFAAELNRYKGQLHLRQGDTKAAEELYRRALSIAEEQEAKLWELRATTNLAQLCRDQGRHTDASDLLTPVYGWFTEGFDTPDLKEAKALLGSLA